MLFLQSVTKHADKLKDSTESKILGNENGPVWKDYFEGGATWAFDVGSQSMTCPIIVEDLDRPRQMLVEVIVSACSLQLYVSCAVAHLHWHIIVVQNFRCIDIGIPADDL
jgi:hypothetical protein